ncbi:hypothetical protein PTTG_29303 [Puccinia triticina 1-1 BBBD Race 1]|uniref:DNA 3'-5' helicase n=1 Tax=Puccinia triticina (isolate 1-1 / race 1 (BBBD)) TaxID=630390 RepID=A0A180G4Y1_PUCT1|nr:hypothetical protein PTTG_29303 [Puccinia triticina 1-1 BBBD Race 1]
MEYSLKSAKDLLEMFPGKDEVENKHMVPTLIYSGTRNATLQVMKIANEAHDTAGKEYNPDSTLIQRYHASTGDMDKEDTISGHEREDFSCISCTMALGLGQNWKRVQRVIHMGRGDPSCISQMIGRCGRDGKQVLAIIFVEKKQKFGLNTPEAIKNADKKANDTRMDALAITPVCIRKALLIDNLHGYIPMDRDDLNYLHEESREADEFFPSCKCSNCDPVLAQFEVPGPLPVKNPKEKHTHATKPKERKLRLIELKIYNTLLERFGNFIVETYGRPQLFFPEEIFGPTDADALARHLDQVKTVHDIANLVGGEQLDGELVMLQKTSSTSNQGRTIKST